MAIHVYMSVKPGRVQPDGSIKVSADAKMNYRGEAGMHDDPQGFVRRMARRGHLVVLTDLRPEAKETTPPKRPGRPQQAPNISYRALTTLEA